MDRLSNSQDDPFVVSKRLFPCVSLTGEGCANMTVPFQNRTHASQKRASFFWKIIQKREPARKPARESSCPHKSPPPHTTDPHHCSAFQEAPASKTSRHRGRANTTQVHQKREHHTNEFERPWSVIFQGPLRVSIVGDRAGSPALRPSVNTAVLVACYLWYGATEASSADGSFLS